MTAELEPIRTPGSTPPQRRWRPALGVLAAVVIVAVSIAMFTGGSDPEPDVADAAPEETVSSTPVTTPPPTATPTPQESPAPTDIARSFIEARDSWNAEATQDLLSPDAVVDDLEVQEIADYPAQYQWYQAVDWRWTVDECVETVTGPTVEVTCTYTHHNAWMDARGDEPIPQSYDFVIVDGEITELTNNFSAFAAWSAFRQWVQATHPADAGVMYDFSGDFEKPRYTPESLALWEQHTTEYVEGGQT